MVDKPCTTQEPPDTSRKEVQGASLTEQEIISYQALFKAEYGIELTKDQALEKGLRLVRLLRVILGGYKK